MTSLMMTSVRKRAVRPRAARFAREGIRAVVVIFIVTTASFMLIDLLPGDAAETVAGVGATPGQVTLVRQQLGLNLPLPERYWDWLKGAFHGNLGHSFLTTQPVTAALAERVPVTFELAVIAFVLALVIAIPLGLYSAYRPGRLVDRSTMSLGFGAASIPHFVLGLFLILALSGGLVNVFPTEGYVSFTSNPFENLRDMALPSLTLALGAAATFRQVLRAEVLSTLQEDYVLLARTKGLTNRYILVRHVLRNSCFSLLTVAGLNFGILLSGSVVVEQIFALPGLGQMVFQSVENRDYLMLQGALLVVSLTYVIVNILVEISYSLVDPRVRN